jgi:hypothetical protein
LRIYLLVYAVLTCILGCGESQTEGDVVGSDISVDSAIVLDASSDSELDVAIEMFDVSIAPDLGLPTCEPALELTVSGTAVRAFDLVRVTPAGGTGQWTFDIIENRSNGSINRETGVYLAGDVNGVTDLIELRDLGCEGSATLGIDVVTPMIVVPQSPDVLPGESIEFEVEGGSGQFEFTLIGEGDSTLIGLGVFRAGETLGLKNIQVTDSGTGQIQAVQVSISTNVGIQAVHETLHLSSGAVIKPSISGGSGVYVLSGGNASVAIQDDVVAALATGTAEITIQDRFLARSTTVNVSVAQGLTAPLEPSSDASNSANLQMVDDLNADGFRDLVFGHAEADVSAGNGGAVYVFLSEPSGQLSAQPAQVLSSSVRDDFLGWSLSVDDVTGDGLPDLVVGVRTGDFGGTNSGGVSIYDGTGNPEMPFETEPSTILPGVNSFDFLGSALTICDFNNDGFLDIATAACFYEDRTADPVTNSQGGIFVYMGEAGGVDPIPDIILGRSLQDGELRNTSNLRLAENRDGLASGDFNGDGVCDLAAGTLRYQYDGRNNSGLVQVFLGQADVEGRRGGLDIEPAMMISETRTEVDGRTQGNGQFGRALRMGDVNGDGKDDLLVNQFIGDVGGQDGGGSYLFFGRTLEAPAMAITSTETADWSFHGNNYDYQGYSLLIDDLNGDGLDDVLTASLYEDYPGRSNTGAVFVFYGQQDGTPSLAPDFTFEGITADSRIGEHFALKSDEDDDGLLELAVYANRSTEIALHVGRLEVHTSAVVEEPDMRSVQTLETQYRASSQRFGLGIDYIGDVDGDGYQDALVSAPYSTHQEAASRSGTAWLYFGTETGLDSTPVPLGAFPELSGSDLLWSVARAGDFNGDGADDFAILLRSDERSSTLNANLFDVPAGCPGRRGDVGGVYVFLGGLRDEIGVAPSFVYWGGQASLSPETLELAGDVNGDGFDDLLLGGHRWDQDGNDVGSIDVISGGVERLDGRIQVVCFPLLRHIGNEVSGNLGISGIGLGDLDGDGCDDFAVGAEGESGGGPGRQGVVWVFKGAGGAGCSQDFFVTRFQTGESQGRFGTSMDAGDLDGDGVFDLLVGARNRLVNGSGTGGAWLVTGDMLTSTPYYPLFEALQHEPVNLNEAQNVIQVSGAVVGSEFGRAVAISGNVMAVGSPSDAVDGVTPVGRVRLYRLDTDNHTMSEFGLFVGEVNRPGGRLGEKLASHPGDEPRFLVGGSLGNGAGLDNGSVYELTLD